MKTYGGAASNHFDGGVLIGDAGSFVDPMTGEGITPGMESALLAAPVLAAALDAGRYRADALAPFEDAYRRYFDPAMNLLTFSASLLRNRHMAKPWLTAFGRGCELAQADADFARTSGGVFGGLDVHPAGIMSQLSSRIAGELALAWPRLVARLYGRSTAARRPWRSRRMAVGVVALAPHGSALARALVHGRAAREPPAHEQAGDWREDPRTAGPALSPSPERAALSPLRGADLLQLAVEVLDGHVG